METFSASDLIKKSASQIKYLREKRKKVAITSNQVAGIKHQSQVIASLNSDKYAEEMRGTYVNGDIMIFFTNDAVSEKNIIEIKSIDKQRPLEDWYFKSSVLQISFYKSLLINSSGWLVTPKFRIKDGFAMQRKKVDNKIQHILLFGEDKYDINCDTDRILAFYLAKIKAILSTWEQAKKFDAEYKHCEYDKLKKYIKIKRIT